MPSQQLLLSLLVGITFLTSKALGQVCADGGPVCQPGEIAVGYYSENIEGDPEETESGEYVTGVILDNNYSQLSELAMDEWFFNPCHYSWSGWEDGWSIACDGDELTSVSNNDLSDYKGYSNCYDNTAQSQQCRGPLGSETYDVMWCCPPNVVASPVLGDY